MSEIVYKMKNRRGLAADWLLADPVLSAGEFGIESDTGKIKIGDGVTAWSVLPYLTDHDHPEIGDAEKIKGVIVDDTDLADGRLLAYDESGDGSLKFVDPPEGGGLGEIDLSSLSTIDPEVNASDGHILVYLYGEWRSMNLYNLFDWWRDHGHLPWTEEAAPLE
jgi:hypothetical protein